MKPFRFVWSMALISVSAVACVESGSGSSEDRVRTSGDAATPAVERRTQAAETDERWFAGGAGSRATYVSEGGQPAKSTGRFVNAGRGAEFGAPGSNGWLVAGESGWVQLLENDGTPSREEREVFGGAGRLDTLVAGDGGWLAGSEDGAVQRIDQSGQPKGSARNPFGSNVAITGGAFGNSGWMVGTADGRVRELTASQLNDDSDVQQLSGAPRVIDVLRVDGNWYVVTESDWAKVTSVGFENRQTLAESRSITAASVEGSTVALGADDGSVVVSTLSNLPTASWRDALGGEAVRTLVSDGQEWLAAGTGGKVRLVDSAGAPQGSVQTVASGLDLSMALPYSGGWWVGLADISAIQSIDGSLSVPEVGSEILGGAEIREVVAYSDGLLAVGDGGSYRRLGADGSPEGSVQTLGNAGTLRGAEWNGDRFAVVGEDGTVATLAPDGEVETEGERLDGEDVAAVSWNGTYWLVVSVSGTARRLQNNGEPYRDRITTGLDGVRHAEFNGDQWMIVGSKGDAAAFEIVNKDGSTHEAATKVEKVDGTFRAVDYNGLEWLAGGDGGMVVRIDTGGDVIGGGQTPGIRDALYGYPVESIDFNGTHYLIGGKYGAVRRLELDGLPVGPASAVDGFETVRSVEWLEARGFAGGPCVSDGFCFDGPCISGTSGDTFCCESECGGACQSCRGEVTGEADGVCAPIPAGDEPPERRETDCIAGPKSSCGLTGACDGNGECAFYGSDVQCSEPSCEEGVRKSTGFCDGSGDCTVREETDCSPYARCAEGEPACASSCGSGDDCVEGFVCVDGECVNPDGDDGGAGDGGGRGGSDDSGGSGGGCSTTGGDGAPGVPWAVAGLVAAAGLRRRVRSSQLEGTGDR